jgi:hypothetical protein
MNFRKINKEDRQTQIWVTDKNLFPKYVLHFSAYKRGYQAAIYKNYNNYNKIIITSQKIKKI